MPPTTRKAPAKKAAPKAVKNSTPPKETTVSEEAVVVAEAVVTTKKKGPKPNPFTRVERARLRADKARAAHAKVQSVTDALADAEREEQEALAALKEAVESVSVSSE